MFVRVAGLLLQALALAAAIQFAACKLFRELRDVLADASGGAGKVGVGQVSVLKLLSREPFLSLPGCDPSVAGFCAGWRAIPVG